MKMHDFLMFMAFFLILLVLGATFAQIARADGVMRQLEPRDTMIGMLERHFQVRPGTTRVLPECNCTVRYVGTTAHGRRYTVIIDKLD